MQQEKGMVSSVYTAPVFMDRVMNFIERVGVTAAICAFTLWIMQTTIKENTAASVALRISIAEQQQILRQLISQNRPGSLQQQEVR